MSTAADWFDNEREFRQLCGDAVSLAHAEASEEFAAEMVKKAKEFGLKTYLSQKQLNWLCQIADWTVPERRNA
jgi:hypothetical protein